ncbi:MAG: hypothetical protein PHW02_00145 [bacterium]|nr:hypothetical protein [bacterium]
MRKILFTAFLILPIILLSQTDMGDSGRTSIHELQAKSYADSSQEESPAQKDPGRTSYIPIAVGAVFIILYAAVKRKRKK